MEGFLISFESFVNIVYNFVDGSRVVVGVFCFIGNLGVVVVVNDDNIIRYCVVDDVNNVLLGSCFVFLFVEEVDDNIVWCWVDVVVNVFVIEIKVVVLELIEVFGFRVMVV